MAVIQCKMCGGDLAFEAGSTVSECEYCGSRQTIPSADNEKKTNLFNRANRLRINNEFDKAYSVYESIVAEFPEEAEAYWGLCLCAYGIEYVDDPATGSKLPTCHRTMTASIMEDANFEQACDYADSVARKLYRDEAKTIDRIQKDILSIAANEAPYDVFICYKETSESGDRTEDSVLSQEIYDALTARGFKVFFSRITLEDKLGVQYEPYIYAALSSAKVMLAIGTQFEYYDAVWVKNEWSRFLSMMKTDRSKTLIPCFKDLDAYDMPKEFKGLQAQDMGKLGWLQDLVRGVEKLCGKGGEAPQSVQPTVVREVVQSNSNAANLMQRVYLFLEDGDWAQAKEYIQKVLDADAKYAPAYVANVLIQNKLKTEDALTSLRKSIDANADWQKALRFADAQRKLIYENYAKTIDDNQRFDEEQARLARLRAEEQARLARLQAEEQARLARLQAEEQARLAKLEAEEKERADHYAAAVDAMESKIYRTAIVGFHSLADYKQSSANLSTCIDAYRRQLQDAEKRKKGNAESKLKTAKEKVVVLEQNIRKSQRDADKAKAAIAENVERSKVIIDELKRLRLKKTQVCGLFSGGRKLKLEEKIDDLEYELCEVDEIREKLNSASEMKQKHLQDLVSELKIAKTELNKTEANASTALKDWTDDAVIAAAAACEAAIAQKVGSYVTFGRYPQTESGTDNTPVEWLVLDVQEDKALLISRYGLDAKAYGKKYVDITWENCTLRTWLKSTFLKKAFSAEEQKAILTTTVDNSASQCFDFTTVSSLASKTTGGNNTQDKLFLLSYAEANKYFGVECIGVKGVWNNTKSRVEPTAYAIKNGVGTDSRYTTADGKAACSWWLRSPGEYQVRAASVAPSGSLSDDCVHFDSKSVRPAFWINLESEIF